MASLTNGLSALVRLGASIELDSDLQTISIGCQENSFTGNYELQTAGKFLLYVVSIQGTAVLVAASLLDSTDPPQVLLKTQDVEAGWELIFRFVSALEKYEVRSLQRPILVGEPGQPDAWVIA